MVKYEKSEDTRLYLV